MSIPKKPSKVEANKFIYKSRCGPVDNEDIPARLKIDKALLDKKNIFADFKRIEPPRQLLAPMLEIQMNEKPTMEDKCAKTDEKKTPTNPPLRFTKKFC